MATKVMPQFNSLVVSAKKMMIMTFSDIAAYRQIN